MSDPKFKPKGCKMVPTITVLKRSIFKPKNIETHKIRHPKMVLYAK